MRGHVTVRWVNLLLVTLTASLVCRGVVTPAMGATAAPSGAPDPVVLLRGVENCRKAITTARLEYDMTLNNPARPGDVIKLAMLVDGERIWCQQAERRLIIDPPNQQDKENALRAMNNDREAFVRAGLGRWQNFTITAAYDGSVVMTSDGEGAIIDSPTASNPMRSCIFDPRVLGLGTYWGVFDNLDVSLDYRRAKSVSILGQEPVTTNQAWHLKLINVYKEENGPVERDLWIGDTDRFPVYKVVQKGAHTHIMLESRYDETHAKGVLPTLVRRKNFNEKGELLDEREIRQLKAEYGIKIDPSTFGLAGLGLRVGQPIVDARIKRRIGYWDGAGVTENFNDAKEKGAKAGQKPITRTILSLVVGFVLLAGLVGVCLYFVRGRRSRGALSASDT